MRPTCAQFYIGDELYRLNSSKHQYHLPGFWEINPNSAVATDRNYRFNRIWSGIPEYRQALNQPVISDPVLTRGWCTGFGAGRATGV